MYEEISFADRAEGLAHAGAIEMVAKRGAVACRTTEGVRKHSSTVNADAWLVAD